MNISDLVKLISDIVHWLRHAEVETVQKVHDLLNPATETVEAALNTQETQTLAAAPVVPVEAIPAIVDVVTAQSPEEAPIPPVIPEQEPVSPEMESPAPVGGESAAPNTGEQQAEQ